MNIAYEAATADLDDANIIDPFHLEAYGETTVNYNRDVESIPRAQSHDGAHHPAKAPIRAPTDMGVNMAGYAIVRRRCVPRGRASWRSCAATSQTAVDI